MEAALVKLVPPLSRGMRLFDVQVSSDGGATWAVLGTSQVHYSSEKGNRGAPAILTIEMPAAGDAVRVDWEQVQYVPAPVRTSTEAAG